MSWNISDMINNPFPTIFKPFTDMIGNMFWFIPITFIAFALYVKTREPIVVSSFLLATGVIMTSSNLFIGQTEIGFIYMIFVAIGITGLLLSLYFTKTRW